MIASMTSDLWVHTDTMGGLVRADWIVGVRIDGANLKIATAGSAGDGSSDGRWYLGAEEYRVCSLKDLDEHHAKRADRLLVELIAHAHAQNIRGVIEVHDGTLAIARFRIPEPTPAD